MAKGLSTQVIKAMLSEEMSDGDEVEVEVTEPPAPPPPAPAVPLEVERREPPPPTPPPPAPPDMNALIQALVTGIQGGLATAATMARDPLPENAVDPGHSVYSHPDGDLTTPRTALRCPMFLGLIDGDGAIIPAFEVFANTCTEDERVSYNQLVPGVYPRIARNDGVTATWRVVETLDDNGLPTRLTVAVPRAWLQNDQQAQMPGQPNFLKQLLAQRETKALV